MNQSIEFSTALVTFGVVDLVTIGSSTSHQLILRVILLAKVAEDEVAERETEDRGQKETPIEGHHHEHQGIGEQR